MTSRSRAYKVTTALLVIIALAAGLVLSSTPGRAAPVVTTDKADYYSNETVTVTGSGFATNTQYDIPVIRPDGSIVLGDGSFLPGWDSVTSDSSGGFTYLYQLDGIKGTYTVEVYTSPWGGPGSGQTPLATVTFTDADIDFTQCTNDTDNNDVRDDCSWTTGAINQNNSFFEEGDAVPQRLFHRVDAAGTYTFGFEYDFTNSSIYAYDFLTNVDGTQSGALLNECGNRPSFITASQCTDMSATNSFLVPVPSDPFDSVAPRENPPGAGARNFTVGCSPACSTTATISFPDPPTGPTDGEAGESHTPDSDPDCFKNCGSSSVVITLTVTTLSAGTRVGIWFAGHLAEAANPPGSPIGWGTGCGSAITCGSSSISGSPFHIKYTCQQGPGSSTCGPVGNRDNQVQIGAVVPPGIIQIIKDAQPDSPQDFAFSGDLGAFLLDDDTDATLSNTATFIDLVPGNYNVSEASVPGWNLSSISCADPDSGTVVNLGTRQATIDLDPTETVTCTFTNNEMPLDVEKVSTVVKGADCTSAPPSSIGVSQSTNICLVSQLRYNSGTPASVTVTDTLTHSPPADCTSTSPPIANQTLPKATIVTVNTIVSIHCFQPSNHTLSWQNCIAITPPPTPAETNTANNCVSANLAVTATTTSDVKANSVTVSSPASMAVNSPFNVTAAANLHNNGPYGPANVDTTLTLALPPDCTTASANPQTAQDTALSTSVTATVPAAPATWSVTCTSPSSHQFSVSASAAVDQLHVSDPAAGNNSTAAASTTNVTATADIKVNSVSVSAAATSGSGAPFNVTAAASLHNNGAYAPVNVDTTFTLTLPADCSTPSANPQVVQDTSLAQSIATNVGAPVTWSVTCSDPSNHTFGVSASAAIDQFHVSDPTAANNSANGSAATSVTATADVKVSGTSVTAPASANAGTPFDVTVTANIHNNGTVNPVNTDTTLGLTAPGDCILTPNTSQTVGNTPLAPSVATPVSATWSVTCSNSSNHTFSASATVAVDQLHVSDPATGNNAGSAGATTAILAQADLKVSGVSVTAPASTATGLAFDVTISAGLHNNGAAPANADATLTLNVPADCVMTPNAPQVVQDTSLAPSTATPASATWSVTCADPSSHQFTGNAGVAVDQIHVSDPTPGNDAGTGNATTTVTGQADVKVSGVSVSAPASAGVNSAFNVTVTAALHNNGSVTPVNVDSTLDLSAPADCAKMPPGSQVQQDSPLAASTSVPVSKTWSVTCSSQSNHDFSGSVSASIDQLHVSDSNGANNGATGGAATTAVIAAADLKVSSVTVTVPPNPDANTPFNVSVDSTMHNNGAFTPANADLSVSLTVPADCTTTPIGSQGQQNTPLAASTAVGAGFTWSVTCTAGGPHSFTGSSTVTLDEVLHVTDPDTANNSGSSTASFGIGTPTPTPSPSPPTTPSPAPSTPTPTPSPAPSAGPSSTPSPPPGQPIPVGGIVGLIDDDGAPSPADGGGSGGSEQLTAGAIAAVIGALLGVAYAARRRLIG